MTVRCPPHAGSILFTAGPPHPTRGEQLINLKYRGPWVR